MHRRCAPSLALSPVVLLATAAMLSVGSVADGAAAAMLAGGASDQQTLTQLAEAIAATAGTMCDENGGAKGMPVAVIPAPLGPQFDLADNFLAIPFAPRIAYIQPLRSTLTNLPPPSV